MKLVFENINNFVRNQDPLKSLNIGYEKRIRDFFRQYDIHDEDYVVKENGEIIFNRSLYLDHKNITELPDNLTVNGSLYLHYSSINNLPDNLIVKYDLDLDNTEITELPDNLKVRKIVVSSYQLKLIKWIKQSKFKDKLIIW